MGRAEIAGMSTENISRSSQPLPARRFCVQIPQVVRVIRLHQQDILIEKFTLSKFK